MILIHGTWASDTTWCKPGGDFYTELHHSAQRLGKHIVVHSWSGALDHTSRLRAAHALVTLIQSYPTTTHITLVCHSHGCNVGILASQLLEEYEHPPFLQHRIAKFYALAPPVNTEEYLPNMNTIEHFYNFFSLMDKIQPVLGTYNRTYPAHNRLANIRVMLEGHEPSHSDLHHPFIGRHLLQIHDVLQQQKRGNFENFHFNQAAKISFYGTKHPEYAHDPEQEYLIELEAFNQLSLLTFFDKNTTTYC